MPPSARSLAEDLRSRSDDQLVSLFGLRPDLLRPLPKSFSDLAIRANSAPSTVTALDNLTAAQLDVIEACCALAPAGRFGVAELAVGLDVPAEEITPLVADLYTRVLLWGGQDDLRVPAAVREALGPHPCGLDLVVRANQTGVRLALNDPEAFSDRVELAPPEARQLLVTGAWGPPIIPAAPGHEWLSGQDFMAIDDIGQLIVPREVALLIRRGVLQASPRLMAPVLPEAGDVAVTLADQHAGHAADQFVRDVDRVAAYLSRGSLSRQANGAFSARDWDRAVVAIGLTPDSLALLIALAWTAQWLDWDDENRLRPTTVFADAQQWPTPRRWGELASVWLRLGRRIPSEAAKVLTTTPDAAVPSARALVLTAVAHGAGAEVEGWLRWFRPRAKLRPAVVGEVLTHAELLGFTFNGVPAAAARLADGPQADADGLAAAIEPHLPALTDRIILQADLTATALGPLESGVERRLTEIADRESGGAATVFRFSSESVRGALAAGTDPVELVAWLASVSTTPVPQALAVLISDQARALPTLTVHSASTVVTCDPAEVDDLLGDPSVAALGLRQVAPGVLIGPIAPDEAARAMRASGRAAALPDAASGPITPRHASPQRRSGRPAPSRVVESLRQVERGEPSDAASPPELRPLGPAQILASLHTAVARHQKVWLSFASDGGDRLTHLIEPLQLESGDVCAFDHTAGEIRTIPLERIVASAAL